jgi:AsmA protein
MPSRLIRRLVLTLAAGAFVILAVIAIIPLIASTQIVRDRIALELSTWSGYQVTLGAAPEIAIWPVFRANLANVRFAEWGGGAQAVIEAEAIEADLSAFAALRGNVVFTHLRLIRPTLHVWRESFRRGSTPGWGGGRIGRSIAAARAAIEANPSAPDAGMLPSDPVGTLEFVDARMFLHSNGRESEIFSSASGRINWPAFNRSATATASGIWRGEVVSVEITTAQPLFLVAGGTAPLSAALRSAPLNISFDGAANLSGDTHFDGSARLSSPSLRRTLEWSRTDIAPGAAVGSVSIESRVTGALGRLKLANTTLTLDDNRGTGTLEMALWQPVPSITGTLAFATIDLRSFMSAFSVLTPDALGDYRTIDNRVADQVALDLRLSATSAKAGSIAFSGLAATAQVKPGLAAFDISDAGAFGGNVQAGMRIDRGGPRADVELRLRGENIDMGALARTMKAHALVPVSRGTFSITLRGTGDGLADVIRTASGSISANFGPGAMAGIDIAKFAERAALGEFFPLSDVGDNSLAFTSVALKAGVENGTAKVERLDVATASGNLLLRGIVPLPGRGLALAGRWERSAAGTEPIPFFVGGSWDAPYISPVMPGLELP